MALAVAGSVVCVATATRSAAADTAPSTQSAPPSDTSYTVADELTLASPPAPETIDQFLVDAKARPAGILRYGPVSLLDPVWKRFNTFTNQYGLNVGLAYTAVYQAATPGPGDRDAAGGDIDLFGDWRLLGAKDDPFRGLLYFAAENRHDLGTGIAPGAIGGQVGSLWGTTNGFGEQDLTVKELYWQQHVAGDRLILRVGKLDPENYYNSNYWQSDSKYFLNQAFSSFPVRSFPGNGLGFNATAKPSDMWYVSAGAQDAQGKKTTVGGDTLFQDWNLFYAAELGFTPDIPGLGRGTYRVTGWYRDAGESNGRPHDSGVTVSIDQRVTRHLVPFFRAGTSDVSLNGVEHMVAGGAGWEGALLTDSDVIGFAVAWGRPADHDLDAQYTAEVFYRLQVSPDNQLTVGYQAIFNPTFSTADEVVGVFEVRWRIAM